MTEREKFYNNMRFVDCRGVRFERLHGHTWRNTETNDTVKAVTYTDLIGAAYQHLTSKQTEQ